jgi:competence protein ComEC
MLAVNLYFLFVGSVPAVQRSWLVAMLYLTGKLLGRHASGLNLLGVALAVEILLDPLISAHLGFQLSFLSCAGILLLHPLCESSLRKLFPKPAFSELPPLAQHVRLLSSYLREALAVTFSVNLAILPLLLLHFHQFPLLSLLYNLFFPFLVSLALFLLLVSLLVHLLFPPLASLLFPLTDLFTAQLLDLASYPPLALDYSLRFSSLPAWPIPLYLFSLFYLSVSYKNGLEQKIRPW